MERIQMETQLCGNTIIPFVSEVYVCREILELSMNRQNGMQRHVMLAVLIGLLFIAVPTMAQQQDSQQPSPAPSESQAPDPKDGKDTKGKNKPGETVGKSKLEKETGTVNDRIFEVIPNYGTVENANELPPLTSGQKFRLATASVFDWGAYPFNGVLAAIAQAKNDPKEWGQGWDAYGKRYGASFADNSIGTYMTTAIFPSLLHEDPRYYQLGKGRFVHRAYHGINRQCRRGGNLEHLPCARRPDCVAKRHHIWFSDFVRRLVQRTEGILAGYPPKSVPQEYAVGRC